MEWIVDKGDGRSVNYRLVADGIELCLSYTPIWQRAIIEDYWVDLKANGRMLIFAEPIHARDSDDAKRQALEVLHRALSRWEDEMTFNRAVIRSARRMCKQLERMEGGG